MNEPSITSESLDYDSKLLSGYLDNICSKDLDFFIRVAYENDPADAH